MKVPYAKKWQKETDKLRKIALDCDLVEQVKWGKPCFTFEKKNIAIVIPLKESCALAFFKGALLQDAKHILQKAGEHSQAGRWVKFTSVKEVTATVLGGHGDQMVPVVSATTVGGIPLDQLVTKAKINKMVERTKVGGGELVSLLGTSAWYAPGAAAAQMVDSICLDEKRILPCTAYLEGEYGINGLYMGVPVKLGTGGVEEIVKLRLTPDEKRMLRASAAAVREVVGVLKKR